LPLITEKDLQEAIAECQGQRNPNASTCIKLAAFLTIQRELFGNPEHLPTPTPAYSFASGPPEPIENTQKNVIDYHGDSDFLTAIEGKYAEDIWPIMDELMESMQVLQPRIYDQVMRKVRNS
jgi:hypothetical protein